MTCVRKPLAAEGAAAHDRHARRIEPDLVLLFEAIAQGADRDRIPPVRVVQHVMQNFGLTRDEALAEIKSFAEGH